MVEQVLLLFIKVLAQQPKQSYTQSTCLDGIYHCNDLIKDCSELCWESEDVLYLDLCPSLCLISRMTAQHCRSSCCVSSTHIVPRQPLFFKELGDFLENIFSFGRSFQCMAKQELFFEVSILDVPNKYKKLGTPCYIFDSSSWIANILSGAACISATTCYLMSSAI